MTRRRNLFYSAIILFIITYLPPLQAQNNDFYSWNGIVIKKDLADFTFYLQEELRFRNHFLQYQEYFTELGIKYNPAKWLSIAQFYRYTSENTLEYIQYKNQWYSDVEVSYEFYRTKLSWRNRYQVNYCLNDEFALYEHKYRNKLQITRNLYKSPLTPIIGYEFFTNVYPVKKPEIYKHRFIMGSDIRINKKLDLNIVYFMELDRAGKYSVNNHILITRICYSF